jgi:hypothetical protein
MTWQPQTDHDNQCVWPCLLLHSEFEYADGLGNRWISRKNIAVNYLQALSHPAWQCLMPVYYTLAAVTLNEKDIHCISKLRVFFMLQLLPLKNVCNDIASLESAFNNSRIKTGTCCYCKHLWTAGNKGGIMQVVE